MYNMTTSIDGQSNTRLKPISKFDAHLDFLRVRVNGLTPERFELCLDFISRNWQYQLESPWSPGGGGVWYPNKVIGVHGFVGGFETNEDGLIEAMLQVSGEYFEQLDLKDQWYLLLGLRNAYKAECTRIDLAIDDPSKVQIPVLEMRKAWEQGQTFGFRKHKYIETGSTPRDLKKTWYFGSRESGKLTRVYDHEGECLRQEVEFKRKYAREVFKEISDINHEFSIKVDRYGEPLDTKEEGEPGTITAKLYSVITGLVLGAIDFRDRGVREDTSRVGYRDSQRLSFYQEYIDSVGGITIRVRCPKPAKSLVKSMTWLKRQVAATLAMVHQGIGVFNFHIWLKELIDYGLLRGDRLKELWIEEMKQNPRLVQVF